MLNLIIIKKIFLMKKNYKIYKFIKLIRSTKKSFFYYYKQRYLLFNFINIKIKIMKETLSKRLINLV